MNKLDQLVSIVVISYNSSEFIIETLESILHQDYSNLELIISDDCSKDNTVALIENWLTDNKNRFSNTLILKSDINLGTSKNLSRGCKNARGKWVKPVPGDDLLLANAISKFVAFAEKHNSKIVYSSIKRYVNNSISDIAYPLNNTLINKTAEQQFQELLKGAPFYSPTEFYLKSFLEEFNYFDSKYRLIEDLPFLLKITKSGVKIDIIDEALMLYRISNSSTSSGDERVHNHTNIQYYKDLNLIYNELLKPNRNISNFVYVFDVKIKLMRMKQTISAGNRKSDFEKTSSYNLINPLFYLLKLKIIKIPQ